MAIITIPRKFDESLDLEVDETAYVVKENTTVTKIVFIRGNIKNREIIHISKVENYNYKQKKRVWYSADFAIVKAPDKIVPNQRTCTKTMCIEDSDGDFIIILK
jgi:archaellum component FlaG (FlaF/FlaG flagellin family)